MGNWNRKYILTEVENILNKFEKIHTIEGKIKLIIYVKIYSYIFAWKEKKYLSQVPHCMCVMIPSLVFRKHTFSIIVICLKKTTKTHENWTRDFSVLSIYSVEN